MVTMSGQNQTVSWVMFLLSSMLLGALLWFSIKGHSATGFTGLDADNYAFLQRVSGKSPAPIPERTVDLLPDENSENTTRDASTNALVKADAGAEVTPLVPDDVVPKEVAPDTSVAEAQKIADAKKLLEAQKLEALQKAEAQKKLKAQQELKARLEREAEAKAKLEAEQEAAVTLKAEQLAREKEEAAAKLKAQQDAEAKAKAEQEAKARRIAVEKRAAEAKAKAEAERDAAARAAADAKAAEDARAAEELALAEREQKRSQDSEGVSEPVLSGTSLAALRQQELSQLPAYAKQLTFDRSRWDLNTSGQASLDGLFEALFLYPEIKVSIVVSSQDSGDEGLNQLLSQQRVKTIKRYLNERGLDSSQFELSAQSGPVTQDRSLTSTVEIKIQEN